MTWFAHAYAAAYWLMDPPPNRHEYQRMRAERLPPFPARPARIAATKTGRRFRGCTRAKA